jgi:type I restriction enzyme, S subunit
VPKATCKVGWTTVAFGDVVRLSTARSNDPASDGFERFVGLEHIEPGDFRIRRWGNIVDGTTFTSVFRPGQVLFGKRRAYQRKIAVADFSGVCSGDIYVLEPRGTQMLPELLPFICQTDAFYDHAVGTSEGSLSPRTNWSSLARFTFDLPSIEEQRRIISVTNAIQQSSGRLFELHWALAQLQYALLDHHLPGATRRYQSQRPVVLQEVVDKIIDYRGKSPPKANVGVPLITARNIRDGFIDPNPREYVEERRFDAWMTRGLPEAGDILFTTEAPLANVAMTPDYKFALGQRSVLIRAKRSVVTARYLYWLLRAPATRREIFARASGTTALGIKQALLRQVPVVIHSMEQQAEICQQLDAIDTLLICTRKRLDDLRLMTRVLMAESAQ